MYSRRLQVFIAILVVFVGLCIVRLSQMQLLPNSYYQEKIAELQKGKIQSLPTIRGRILDRKSPAKVLAIDEPRFSICVNYPTICFADDRVKQAKIAAASKKTESKKAIAEVEKDFRQGRVQLRDIIIKCSRFAEPNEIEKEVQRINNKIWNLRTYLAWKRTCPDEIFEEFYPDVDDRLRIINKVNLAEMRSDRFWRLIDLENEDQRVYAQLEFIDTNSIKIEARSHRIYPYNEVACQTIGWVGPCGAEDEKLFSDNPLLRYQPDELCGREDGAEFVCEAILRGRRGQILYNRDSEVIGREQTQFGKDVRLSIDIDLQKQIESSLADPEINEKYWQYPASAVVIDVATGQILALVSTPTFDLNTIREDYDDLPKGLNSPLINRALFNDYPPGSVFKPMVYIAAADAKKINADEVISCPSYQTKKPRCWLYKSGGCHDDRWYNNARNAIRGSCNVYFSELAKRLDPKHLQSWLFMFGFGRDILSGPAFKDFSNNESYSKLIQRKPRQQAGTIWSGLTRLKPKSFEDVLVLNKSELRYFGIGQGNARVTLLQVANAMAALARDGVFKFPVLYLNDFDIFNQPEYPLGISEEVMDVIRDGMRAVIEEDGGTAHTAFRNNDFAYKDIICYGKTGSTQLPATAWFAGFAQDNLGRAIAIAVLVEKGQSGGHDAAPLAREIIQYCVDAGYVGSNPQY